MRRKFLALGIRALSWVIIGGLVMTGMRIVEWLIPEPDTRLVICSADSAGQLEVCRTLAELQDDESV